MKLNATFRLLVSPLMIAISGGLRLYVAFLLVGSTPIIPLCIAAVLIVYATYTLDRTVKTKEDEINRREEEEADRHVGIGVVVISLVIAILILIKMHVSIFIAFFPFFMGFIYSRGIKIGKFKLSLKRGYGIKNIVVAFTWAFTTCVLIYKWTETFFQLLLVFAFFFLKSFINSVICDCRDIKGDLAAGLTTIPIYLGEKRTRKILQILHFVFHLTAITLVLLNIIELETIILVYSWIFGMIYIWLYANSKKTVFRTVAVHGEWAYILAFRRLTI